MYKLKDCPFCGGKAEFVTKTSNMQCVERGFCFQIECSKCGAHINRKLYELKLKLGNQGQIETVIDERQLAVDEWNKRTLEENVKRSDKEEDLIIKIPCRVGGILFAIIQDKIYELELKDYRRNHFAENGKGNELDLYCVNVHNEHDFRYLYSGDYSKVFLTREEAEKALKESGKS